jgi:hypothetical protein
MTEADVRVHIRRVVFEGGSDATVDAPTLHAAIQSALASRLGVAAVSRDADGAAAPSSAADTVAERIAAHIPPIRGGGPIG